IYSFSLSICIHKKRETKISLIDERIQNSVERFVEFFTGSNNSERVDYSNIHEASTDRQFWASNTNSARFCESRPLFHPEYLKSSSMTESLTPVLLLCPSDISTLFYFVCP